jgi:[NiFe] hydrogenase assembly HybE family chaperone
MTEPAPLPAERPSPAGALEALFRTILQEQMKDVPMLNPALGVEAVGFRPWSDHWLGVLITPWFMNLMLTPRVTSKWQAVAEGKSRHYVFPAGVFEFIGGRDPVLGDYQACSLFSPMFDFANHQGAHDTAVAALDALFDVASREPAEVSVARPTVGADPTATAPRAVSKRDFLFGLVPRAGDGS